MQKIIIIGVGAQGSTIAKTMNDDPNVSEIICADYDEKAANDLGAKLDKATALKLDASDIKNVIKASQGMDLIVNGLPLEYNLIIMEAALTVNANYMDMAGPMVDELGFVGSYELMFSEWDKKFKDKGLTALIGAGSAPGIANVLARESVEKMDTVESIDICIYDGIWSKKFTPFWWSPEVAFEDMAYVTFRYEDGKIIKDKPFSRPIKMKFRGVEEKIRMVDHEHDEPVTMGLLADTVLKGVKNVSFRYGGPAVELAESLYKMGFLSNEPVDVNGTTIVPMDLTLKLTPPAPKYPKEIQEIIDEGMDMEEGAFLIRVIGTKDNRAIKIDNYVNGPGLQEAFEIAGMSHESYMTGQCGSVFTKMLANEQFTETGVFVPEQLHTEARKYFLSEMAKLGITVDEIVERRLFKMNLKKKNKKKSKKRKKQKK